MDFVKNPIIIGLFGGILILLVTFIDHKYNNIEKKPKSYFRLLICYSFIIGFLFYLNTEHHDDIRNNIRSERW